MALIPWRRRQRGGGQSLGGGNISSTGGGLPPSGWTGDLDAARDLLRRRWEQQALDSDPWGSWGGLFGGPAFNFPWVSEWAARQVPALTAGMRLISSVCMQLPLVQKRGDDPVDPPATIIANPAPGPNRCLADFIDEYVSDVLLYGNYVALVGPPDSTGWPSQLIPLDVTTVSVARDPETLQPIYSLEGLDDYLAADQIFHVAIDKRSGELTGRGVLPTMSGALGSALAADAYAGRYFSESAVPSGVITDTRPNLTQEQAAELKSKWMAAVNGTRVPVVVPSSTSFQPLATDADKAQLVQARQWDATMVAMVLGVPPFLLGIETQRHTYTNAENEFGRFVTTTIMRLLAPLEQQITLQCLPRGNVAEFSTAALLRPDTLTRAQAAVALYGAEIITLPEARSLAGYPAAGGPPQSTPRPTPAPAPAVNPPAPNGNGAGDGQNSATLLEVIR